MFVGAVCCHQWTAFLVMPVFYDQILCSFFFPHFQKHKNRNGNPSYDKNGVYVILLIFHSFSFVERKHKPGTYANIGKKKLLKKFKCYVNKKTSTTLSNFFPLILFMFFLPGSNGSNISFTHSLFEEKNN